MFFFKANFNFSDDSEVINVFYMCVMLLYVVLHPWIEQEFQKQVAGH